jgi:hypothetical protein
VTDCKNAAGKPGYVCEASWLFNGSSPEHITARFTNDGGAWRVAEWE